MALWTLFTYNVIWKCSSAHAVISMLAEGLKIMHSTEFQSCPLHTDISRFSAPFEDNIDVRHMTTRIILKLFPDL